MTQNNISTLYAPYPSELVKDKQKENCIYVQLKNKRFENWIVEVSDLRFDEIENDTEYVNLHSEYSVVQVPKSVTDEEVVSSKEELDKFLGQVLLDILEQAVYNTEQNQPKE
jgi:hypothetical protein